MHTSNHIVVPINMPSARLDAMSIPTTFGEYHGLDAWAAGLGDAEASGIEGAGSYGATRSRDFLAKGHTVLDVMRPNRQLRYLHDKSNSLDAGSAARSVLNGQATAFAKTQGGNPERIRSKAALAELRGIYLILAPSAKTNRMRLNRGGNRQGKCSPSPCRYPAHARRP